MHTHNHRQAASFPRDAAFADALREHLARERSWRFEAIGRSMHPVVPSDSLLELEPLPGLLAPGDLLAFVHVRRRAVCCHRVVSLREDGAVLTRGDNCGGSDGWIERALHVGVVRRYRVGGRWFDPRVDAPSATRRLAHRAARIVSRLAQSVRPPAACAAPAAGRS